MRLSGANGELRRIAPSERLQLVGPHRSLASTFAWRTRSHWLSLITILHVAAGAIDVSHMTNSGRSVLRPRLYGCSTIDQRLDWPRPEVQLPPCRSPAPARPELSMPVASPRSCARGCPASRPSAALRLIPGQELDEPILQGATRVARLTAPVPTDEVDPVLMRASDPPVQYLRGERPRDRLTQPGCGVSSTSRAAEARDGVEIKLLAQYDELYVTPRKRRSRR